jgi:DNA-binding transcriptional regulator YhcF (GntR family)
LEWKLDNERPIYSQLIEHIEQAVVAGTWPPGQKLPGVRELAAEAGVNPNTMQRALAELETIGLLFTQRTSGRFVTEDAQRIAGLREGLATGRTKRYVKDMGALGCDRKDIIGYINKTKEED